MNKWIAHYQPARPEGMKDPSKRGFNSKEAAIEYVCRNHVCDACKEDIKQNRHGQYKSSDPEDIDNLSGTGCAVEWLFLKEKDFDKAETHLDLMEAAGFKRIK